MIYSKRLSEDYAIDFSAFHKIREFRDGISFFNLSCRTNLRGDHTPSFTLFFMILNFKIVEVDIYNINHENEDKVL